MKVVMIFNHGGKNLVWPPCLLVKPGEKVTFKVANPGTRIYFPEREIFDETGSQSLSDTGRGTMLNLGSDGMTLTVRSQPDLQTLASQVSGSASAQLPRVYPYSVYCSCGNDFAEGHSSPVMIIEPPEPSYTSGTQTTILSGLSEQMSRAGRLAASRKVKAARPVKKTKK